MEKLEKKLFDQIDGLNSLGENGNFDLGDALLIVGGVKTNEGLIEYNLKMEKIYSGFDEMYSQYNTKDIQNEIRVKSNLIHEFSKGNKIQRYREEYFPGDFEPKALPRIVDKFLYGTFNESMHDCLGGTEFQGLINLKNGIVPKLLMNKDTILYQISDSEGVPINVVSQIDNGFDYDLKGRRYWELNFENIFPILVGKKGDFAMTKNNFDYAIEYYDYANQLLPDKGFFDRKKKQAMIKKEEFDEVVVEKKKAEKEEIVEEDIFCEFQ